ncbi:hypothetical protein J6590_029580 [Homalodisca vitripennis]|nr:hypothetical protein J6590_029580 [Homalodisca vitripennis]
MVSPATGVTPLLLAMMGGHYDLAELLLKFGADKSITSMLGQDVFQLALVSGDRKLLRLLQEDSPTLTGCFSLRVKKPEDEPIDPLYTSNNIHLDLQRDTFTLFRNSPSRPVFKTCDDDTEIDSISRERLTPSLPTVFLSSPQKSSSPLSRTWDCNRLYNQYNIGGLVSPRVFTPKSPANSINGMKKKKLLNKIGRPSWLKKLTKRRTRSVGSEDNIDFNISKPNGFDFSQLLFALGIDEFYSVFKEQELDMGTFLTLTIEDLESMGIHSQISQERILKSIKMLQKIQL